MLTVADGGGVWALLTSYLNFGQNFHNSKQFEEGGRLMLTKGGNGQNLADVICERSLMRISDTASCDRK